MTTATWIAIVVLGPGSIAVFLLFLRDARRILRRPGGRSAAVADGEEQIE
jgi:hypothetical protein